MIEEGRPAVGRTPAAEGGGTQERGGSLELEMELVGSLRKKTCAWTWEHK